MTSLFSGIEENHTVLDKMNRGMKHFPICFSTPGTQFCDLVFEHQSVRKAYILLLSLSF